MQIMIDTSPAPLHPQIRTPVLVGESVTLTPPAGSTLTARSGPPDAAVPEGYRITFAAPGLHTFIVTAPDGAKRELAFVAFEPAVLGTMPTRYWSQRDPTDDDRRAALASFCNHGGARGIIGTLASVEGIAWTSHGMQHQAQAWLVRS